MTHPRQGAIWWVNFPRPAGRRPALVLTRSDAIPHMTNVTVAPLTRTIRAIDSEVVLSPAGRVPFLQAGNLLVPVCLSASHIAYGSIRMEPVFMVLGQSAAPAACLALEAQTPVQRVEYAALRARLIADGQVVEWTGPRPMGK